MLRKNRIIALLLAVTALFVLSACGAEPSGKYGYPYRENEPEEATPAEAVDPAVEHFQGAVDHVEQRVDGSDLTVQVYLTSEWEGKLQLAWYLYLADMQTPLITDLYSEETVHTFSGLEPGEYQVKYFLKDEDFKKSYFLDPITLRASIWRE